MDFGSVPLHQVDNINFILPPEPPANAEVLPGRPHPAPKVYMGCARFREKTWVGRIYPTNTKDKDYLSQYVKHFNTIELNATHYKIYGPDTITSWAANAKGRDFVFCPKMVKDVSHAHSLLNKEQLTEEFLQGIRAFGDKLGPVFIQLNETFSAVRRPELYAFLETLPKDLQFFLEVRHPDWFNHEATRNDLFNTLKEMNIGAVITDTSGRRDCCHMRLTVRKAFIRFVGNSLHPTDFPRSAAWVERIKYWLDQGMEEVYFFIHMKEELTALELAVYLAGEFEKQCGIKLARPVFIQRNELF
jgi:uncharacterized protein YecE (DUF72 family)